MPTDAVGFWSYAHDDDQLDNGAILRLADAIANEFALLTGKPLKLFVDRNSIEWGDAWRERINSALAQTTFFIAAITPRYFQQAECRRELLEFAAKASSLGVEQLLLPILYVKPPDFSENTSDEAVALVARTQYVDWQRLRLLKPNSRKATKSVNALARRLVKISEKVAEDQFSRELSADLESDGVDGITELVDHIMELLPEWLDAVIGDNFLGAQADATWMQYLEKIQKLKRAHAAPSAIVSTRIRAAREMLPLIERNQKSGRLYLTRSIQLDPYISALARLIAEHPESYPLAIPVREAIDEAIDNIRRADEKNRTYRHKISDHFAEWQHLGRIFHSCIVGLLDATAVISEGNDIVRRWDTELTRPSITSIETNGISQGSTETQSQPPADRDASPSS
jgi:TIR domain